MTPGKFDLNLYRGDTYAWRVLLWEDVAQTVPVDLTGATVAAQYREKAGGTTVVNFACVVTLPNTIDVTIAEETWETAPAAGAWDLEVQTADGQVMTVLAGKVTVVQDVTVVP